MRARYIVLIIMMGLAACGKANDPAKPDPAQSAAVLSESPGVETATVSAPIEETFTIVMLGDSLTAGYGLAADEALPEQLGLLLASNGYEVDVINAGVSGDTTAGAWARYDWSVASANPDLLIVALGANDFLNGLPAATARENLSSILTRAREDGLSVILAGVGAGDVAEEDPRTGEYAAIYPELAEEYDVPLFEDLLRGVRGNLSYVQLDGLHPTREGVKVMAARMAKFVGAFLPEEGGVE